MSLDDKKVRVLVNIVGGSGTINVPSWSPDSRHIAFDAQPGGNPDIYVVEADGGPIQRITSQPSDDARPSRLRGGLFVAARVQAKQLDSSIKKWLLSSTLSAKASSMNSANG